MVSDETLIYCLIFNFFHYTKMDKTDTKTTELLNLVIAFEKNASKL